MHSHYYIDISVLYKAGKLFNGPIKLEYGANWLSRNTLGCCFSIKQKTCLHFSSARQSSDLLLLEFTECSRCSRSLPFPAFVII